jgi:predicted outer membrane repeat protein
MYNSFGAAADLSGYTALPAGLNLMSKNTANSYGSAIAAKMDFSDYDLADEQALNQILWHDIKGPDVPMPAPVRRALPVSGGLLAFSH